ncbi:uncharacterized protein LOC126899413 isoform X4 [Daktulosphaira vitifoliae]|uniref:uncharacterized protein LOC126899413 isoform X4 n=1 Tax=Daktulosphaira vitifoliae TaxID=58002 RepID=UPI0021AA7E6B|nr:uncharacterized protein LOC126899413 isoform X4 [Daktulosphaira vitifoliae]
MTSLNVVSKCLLLFCVIVYTESKGNTIRNCNIMNNLFKNIGWKNLKRVKHITYLNNNNNLLSIIQEPIIPATCCTKIRATTIFLGCTYASILLDIVTVVENQRLFCEKIMNNNKLQGHNGTEKLLDILSNITSFAKLMQGALYAIEKLHRKPWNHLVRYHIILKLAIDKFLNLQNQLNNQPYSKEIDNNAILHNIKLNITQIERNIKLDVMKYCKLERSNIFVLANKLKVEYNNIQFNEENIKFYNSGSEIILSEIKMLILENFTNLGFELNSKNGEIFIPSSLDGDFEEADNDSEIPPATIPIFYDFLQKEAENKSEISPAPIPVFLDSFNKEVENKSEIFPASISNFCNSHHTEAENKSEISPAPIPVFLDSFNKEVDNDSEISPATIPVFYDFLQKDLIGDVTMNDEFEIETEDLTKKETRNFISSFK